MYLPLILFFGSLAGITVMIGRKLLLQSAGVRLENREEFLFEIPHPEEIKHITIKSVKKYGYITLVTTIKLYVKSLNFAKTSIKEILEGMENVSNKYLSKKEVGEKEKKSSKFLDMISEYKLKIADIKQKIHEEENK